MGQSQGGFSDDDGGDSSVPPPIKFHFYSDKSRLNSSTQAELSAEWVRSSGLHSAGHVTLLIHGFNTTYQASFLQGTKNALLMHRPATRVLMVDYKQISRPSSGGGLLHFPKALRNVVPIAMAIADFVCLLVDCRAVSGPESVHLIGESLGTHIAGHVGKEIRRRTGKQLQRITALDPAGPYFESQPEERRLCTSDAAFVDVLHSNAGALGCRLSLGHVDFYLNGGGPIQPKYANDDDDNWLGLDRNDKSHAFAVEIFSETVQRKSYYGCACHQAKRQCAASATDCPSATRCGYDVPLSSRGNYYVKA